MGGERGEGEMERGGRRRDREEGGLDGGVRGVAEGGRGRCEGWMEK